MGLFRPGTSAGRPKTAQPNHSSLRGRISGPIPIETDFPILNTSPDLVRNSRAPPPPEPNVEELPSSRSDNPPASESTRVDNTESVAMSGPSQASNASASPPQRRTMRSSGMRYSIISDGTDGDRPQRKKSTLKSTLGRFFKRKRKGSSEVLTSDTRSTEQGNSAQRQNDTPASNRGPKEDEPKRASAPLTEFERPLRSHSVGPNDMLAITGARSSVPADPILLRRRAASSNRILSQRIRDFDGQLIGLSPRPASSQGRGCNPAENEDPEDIGRAITSDSQTHRRRSRSLSQLQEVIVGHVHVRKRSDEIRYWRQSFHPTIMSPNSSTVNNDDVDALGDVDVDADVDVDVDADQDQDAHAPLETPLGPPEHLRLSPTTPQETFDFGPITSEMRIEPAVGLEDRIAALEVRNQKLEKLVSQLFQVVPGVNHYVEPAGGVPETPDRAPPAVPRARAATYAASRPAAAAAPPPPDLDLDLSSVYSLSRQHSAESFGDGNTFIGSLPPPSQRPTSNATVRGATSLPALLGEGMAAAAADADGYAALKALLDAERGAREALEARVTRLGRRLDAVAGKGAPQRLEMKFAAVSAFDDDDDDDDELLTAGAETESEAYKTPRSEEGPGLGSFGAFGEDLRGDAAAAAEAGSDAGAPDPFDGARKKAARTLSLSQLTLKRSPPRPRQHDGVGL
ncbi:hypothetical protein GGS23DRAFT_606038 [Durotheca rogersii]|uniref:uncharacterized protein n=1 Tax=Durotheca rogersii TaxID=419775 RepID=UPI00222110AA|nr:uncharacterized protein GGS23DRAFT_606038 [Durotheca rogersii]KAI5861779.1 hypothetical protein GGS23DRAFT_606038 [Durotheca rogersii]